jgi:hypothetical protein
MVVRLTPRPSWNRDPERSGPVNPLGASTGLGPLLPLGAALAETGRQGYARVPGALSGAWRTALVAEVVTWDFAPVPEQVGEVRQRAEELAVRLEDATLPVTASLAAALARAVVSARTGIEGLACYRPNEATYQRYRGPDAGISPHRDFTNHRLLVAVFTLAGRARFRVVADRTGNEELAAWQTQPGDLCLLRGPGFGGEPDGRPLHAIGPPLEGERLSLAFRMTASRGERENLET